MIGYIYKITNQINNKSYIGKTYLTVEQRWKSHIRESRKNNRNHRPLYKAINKYGIQNFLVETLGEYEEGILEQKESEYIEIFNTYNNGYNATLGGDGSRYLTFTDEEVIEKYQYSRSAVKVAKELNCSSDTVLAILKNYNIEVLTNREKGIIFCSKQVSQYTKDMEWIADYDTIIDASIQCFGTKDHAPNIGRCCKGQRKTCKGFIWRYKI